MRVLIDTNTVIDFLQKRTPYFEDAYAVMALAEDGMIEGFVTAKEITDVYYIAHRAWHSKPKALEAVEILLKVLTVADTTAADIYAAALGDYADFEDGVMVATAERLGLDAIVTRDGKGFAKSATLVYTPRALAELASGDTHKE